MGTPEELKQQTDSASLEEAFLSLTGSTIRDETAGSADQLRMVAKLWSNRR
jgi:ABC-2 type transport system ATP-binding protein